jgi:methyltransferase-like protein
VLELGCNRGLHLIGMAILYPDAQFVGVDVSESSIARAVELSEALELTNIGFRVMDVAQLSGRAGECDYLIAHGLYSWVSESLREKIFEICGRVLADNGIAFISFNTYPGYHLRKLVAGMMSIHAAGIEDPAEKVKQGAALVSAVLRALGEESPFAPAIRAELDSLVSKNPLITYFDEFAEENTPVYFSEFMRRAQLNGLQYLSEAEIARVTSEALPPEASELLEGMADTVTREQYTDFFRLGRFRQALLCRDTVTVDRENLSERLSRMYIGCPLQPAGELEINTDTNARFVSQAGAAVTVNQPFVKAVIDELGRSWPGRLSYSELLERAAARVGAPQTESVEMLTKTLFKMFNPNLLEIDVSPYPFPAHASEKPVGSKLARLQAATGTDVISMRHNVVDLDDPAARTVLRLLDGTRDREEILQGARLAGHDLDSDQLDAMLERMSALSLLVA